MSETSGRCRREVDERRGSPCELVIADALDRLAADVAAVKAGERDIDWEDVLHFVEAEKAWVSLVEEQRDAAIRERDEARAEVERSRMQLVACAVLAGSNTTESLGHARQMHPDYDCDAVQSVIRAVEREIALRADAERLRGELAAAIKARDDANAASVKLMEERNAAVTRRDERDSLKALVDELKAARDQWRALAWDQSEVKDAARAESDELRAELDKARAEVGRLLGELAEARAETQRIQDEADDREETERVKRLKAEIEKTHRALLNRTCERDEAKADAERLYAELAARPAAAGWLTEGERRILAAHVKSLREQRASLERHGQTLGYSANPGALKHEADAIDAILARSELAARPAANSAPEPRGWLTDEERQALLYFRNILWSRMVAPNYPEVKGFCGSHLERLDAILARAGSPPVVEVPVMRVGGIHEVIHSQYRAALDKAGVQWKEVPRE